MLDKLAAVVGTIFDIIGYVIKAVIDAVNALIDIAMLVAMMAVFTLICYWLFGGWWSLLPVGLFLTYWLAVWSNQRRQNTEPQNKTRASGHYGDAGFAYVHEVNQAGLFANGPRAVPLGRYIENYGPVGTNAYVSDWSMAYEGENNIITLGPAGTGKGTCAIIPALLSSSENMFVLDVKGENYCVTGAYRRHLGHEVIVLNPFGVWGLPTHRYNPLQPLVFRDGVPPRRFASDIKALGQALIVAQSKEPHWDNRARDLVVCLMAHLCSRPEETATLPRVREILGLPRDEFTLYMTKVRASAIPLVRDNAGSFTNPASEEVGSIISTACGHLDWLLEPELADFVSESEFDFAELRRGPMTVYLIVPPRELDSYSRFVRVMVQALFNAMSEAPGDGQHNVLIVLDEQAKLGRMSIIEDSAALLRGYGVRIWSIFQDLNQVKALYKERWETFISNAGVVQLFTPNDATTADYFSKRIGDRTVEIVTHSQGISMNQGATQHGETQGAGSSENWSCGPQARPFYTATELYALSRNEALLFARGLKYPVRAWKLDYRDNGGLQGRDRPNPYYTNDPQAALEWQIDPAYGPEVKA